MFILYTYICLVFVFVLTPSPTSHGLHGHTSPASTHRTVFEITPDLQKVIFPSSLGKVISPFLFLLLLLFLSSFHPTSPLYRLFHAASADRWQAWCWLEELHTRRRCIAVRNSSLHIIQWLLILLFLHLLLLKAACFCHS